MTQGLLAVLKRQGAAIGIDELAAALGMKRFDKRLLRNQLEQLVRAGEARRVGSKRYRFAGEPLAAGNGGKQASSRTGKPKSPASAPARGTGVRDGTVVTGIFSQTRSGVGYVAQPGGGKATGLDVVVPEGLHGGAMHGDRVRVEVRESAGGRRVGRIVGIEERARRFVAGTLAERRGRFICEPLDDRIPPVLLEGDDPLLRRAVNQIVLVTVNEPEAGVRSRGQEMARGTLKKVLGDLEDPSVQFDWIVSEFRLPESFPAAVMREAESFGAEVKDADKQGRTDLRGLPIVTIDGEDAKDFDDAVLVERSGRGYRLLVSIADVSHYVRPGTALDDEALLRATSIYLPGRVIPMLPEALSNELCSLKPGVDRLALTCEIEFDASGRPVSKKFYESVIRNHERMTYTLVQQLLDGTSTEAVERHKALLPNVKLMEELAARLLDERMKKGAIDLELPELRFDFDATGRAVGMTLKPRLFAYRIIEEFMLAANRAAAELFMENELPFVYRIHERPDTAKVDALNEQLAPFGVSVDYQDEVRPEDIQKAVEKFRGKPVERAASMLILRSLKQARYSPRNEGHFGLAFSNYTHFTSPIRRYPDLEVHRLLRAYLRGQTGAIRAREPRLEEICNQSSERERLAMTAERAMHDIKTAEFMQTHLFSEFDATVTSVARHGFYVSIDQFGAEGLVPLEGIDGDHYTLTADGSALAGQRTGKTFAAGDRVHVQAVDASIARRRILFRWLRTDKRVGGVMLRNTRATARKPPSPKSSRGGRGRRR